MKFLTLILGLAISVAAPLNAASLPKLDNLTFDVMRKGKDIGDHSFKFNGSTNAFSVKVSTNIVAKIPLIQIIAYSFQHSSVEMWRNGKLQKLTSKTNDDGTPKQLNSGPSANLPASLWNVDIVRSKKLLNTIDGKIMSVRSADLGFEMVPTKRGKVEAHHYRISGELKRDLWYDANDALVRVSFKADDGSTITYVRK
ncbi:MAG: hypothetical protein JKX71_09770 [Amylibacter sp.]|nr:hypothetical protein [Amylibacter sp.]